MLRVARRRCGRRHRRRARACGSRIQCRRVSCERCVGCAAPRTWFEFSVGCADRNGVTPSWALLLCAVLSARLLGLLATNSCARRLRGEVRVLEALMHRRYQCRYRVRFADSSTTSRRWEFSRRDLSATVINHGYFLVCHTKISRITSFEPTQRISGGICEFDDEGHRPSGAWRD